MTPTVRKLTQYVPLTREEFRSRFFEKFYDPGFDDVQAKKRHGARHSAGDETSRRKCASILAGSASRPVKSLKAPTA
jgi:hypothetical protein